MDKNIKFNVMLPASKAEKHSVLARNLHTDAELNAAFVTDLFYNLSADEQEAVTDQIKSLLSER